jgi:hypothetical protein
VVSMTNPCGRALGFLDQDSVVKPELNQNQSQSHVTTDGQSVSMSWCRVDSGTCDQILLPV